MTLGGRPWPFCSAGAWPCTLPGLSRIEGSHLHLTFVLVSQLKKGVFACPYQTPTPH